LREGKPLRKRAKAPLAGAQVVPGSADPTPIEPPPDPPLKATEYAGPRPLQPPTDHKTLETETVKLHPEDDPRRATTQKSLRTPAGRDVAETAEGPDATIDANATIVDAVAPGRSGGKKLALVAIGCVVTVLVLLAAWSRPGDQDHAAAIADPPRGTAAPAKTAPKAAPTVAPTRPVPAAATTTPDVSDAVAKHVAPASPRHGAATPLARPAMAQTPHAPPKASAPVSPPTPPTPSPLPTSADPKRPFM
jgi:hypothetical protein